jgi:hypothetical protein
MKTKKLDPRDLARCALTSLRLARIHQNFFSDALPDLKWKPVDEKSTAKAASKIFGHVGTLFPLWEMWDEDYEMAEDFSQYIPITVLGFTDDEISDLMGDHAWHDLEVYLFAFDGWFGAGDEEEAGEELACQFDIHQPAPIWKIFLKLETMLIEGDERLQQDRTRWRNMARRFRYLTANTEHQFLDRDIETQNHSGQMIPWEKEWVDALTEQWAEAEPYLDSTWAFVNWVIESPGNFDLAIAVVRLVCDEVAADEQMANVSLNEVHTEDHKDLLTIQQRLNAMEWDENDKPENEKENEAS